MADAKDILGVRGGGAAAAPAGRKVKEAPPAKPKGVSREVHSFPAAPLPLAHPPP